jgi:hypothetical protein
MRAQRGTLEASPMTCGTSRMSLARRSGVPVGAWLYSLIIKAADADVRLCDVHAHKGVSHRDSARHATAAPEVMRSIRLEEAPRTGSRCRTPRSHQHPRHGSSIVAGSQLRTIANSTASGIKCGSPVSSFRLVFIPELTPQPLKEKYMHVPTARPAKQESDRRVVSLLAHISACLRGQCHHGNHSMDVC